MRAYYAVGCLLLVAVAIFLGVCNLRFKDSPREKALSKTPKDSEYKIETPKGEDRSAKLPEIKTVWEKNVFAQSRGSVEKQNSAQAAPQVDFELVGICKFGQTSGAVIGSKSRGGFTPMPGAGPQAPGGGAMPGDGKSGRKFYVVGQRLGNGFVLKDVQGDRVVLTRGSEELILKIQFESDGSKNRRLASISVNAKPRESGMTIPEAGEAKALLNSLAEPPQPGMTDETGRLKAGKPAAKGGLPQPPTAPPMQFKHKIMT